MDRFTGRVAVVTGASSGIGEDLAVLLAQAGLVVVAVARREQRLQDLAARTQHATGTIRPYVADMTKAEEVSKLFQWVDTALGGITVLVNNAGVFSAELLQDTETAKIEEVVNVNLTAVMLCCREAMNNMKKHDIRDGHIVNINSLLGHSINGMMPLAAYTATKHAITGFSRALRLDVQKIPGFKLRVSAISPAAVITDMVSLYLPESMHDVMLPPREVANAVIYVISCPLNVEISELLIRATGSPM